MTAAANPVNAVLPSSTVGAGNSAASANSSERPFASVLAEQTGKTPKSPDKEPPPAAPAKASDKATKATDKDTEATTPATAAAPAPDGQSPTSPIASAVPIAPIVAVDLPQAAPSDMDAESGDTQGHTAAALIQAMLQPSGAGPAQAESPTSRQTNSLAAPATALPPEIDTKADLTTTPREASIADMRLAVARDAHSATTQNDAGAPAKLAAPQEVFALPVEARGVSATDFLAGKSDTGLAQAASMIAATPMHAASAMAGPASHGGEYRIAPSVGGQQWETAVGNSLVVMTGARQDRAELVLTPPQLGRIEVSISMKGDEASAVFVSASPAVREAIENSLPRLREVLADAGITLGQTQVGAEPQGQAASERQNGDNASRRGIADTVGEGLLPLGAENRTNTAHRVISRSMVDTYA
jgi:flagellar hook-length control protein FliK